MILYEKREDYVELQIVERKGHRSAYFPWQREPHIVATFGIAGVPEPSLRFHIKNDFDLDQIWIMFHAMVEDVRKAI